MPFPVRTLRATALAVLVAVGLAGCGDDNNSPPATPPAPTGLTATVADDGLPKPRVPVQRAVTTDATRIQAQANSSSVARPRGLAVSWMQLRGPAKVTFEPAGPTAVAAGTAAATARFSAPGIYVLRATANDGALSTKSDVTVTVQ